MLVLRLAKINLQVWMKANVIYPLPAQARTRLKEVKDKDFLTVQQSDRKRIHFLQCTFPTELGWADGFLLHISLLHHTLPTS